MPIKSEKRDFVLVKEALEFLSQLTVGTEKEKIGVHKNPFRI
jgi:hypothetical protein